MLCFAAKHSCNKDITASALFSVREHEISAVVHLPTVTDPQCETVTHAYHSRTHSVRNRQDTARGRELLQTFELSSIFRIPMAVAMAAAGVRMS